MDFHILNHPCIPGMKPTCLWGMVILMCSWISLSLKSSIRIMGCDYKSRSCFSGVLGYPGLAVVGELGSDGAMLPWFLLVMFLHLPFAIWLSVVLAGVDFSDGGLSVIQASVSVNWSPERQFLSLYTVM